MSAPSSSGSKQHKEKRNKETPKRLVLCFDGTGNQFSGSEADTNIVKIYKFCDRETKGQFHYYQPGIGTYTAGTDSLSSGPIGQASRWLSQTVDQGLATTFDSHLVAGYRFIMRYYKRNDKIYIFGFSRGAFTARFLASMISHVGLLSQGNEEMVPFALSTYMNGENAGVDAPPMDEFKKTFCRPGVKVEFLGLFDTVASVAYFNLFSSPKTLPNKFPSANHIRHAVALDERRLKFKPALFDQEIQQLELKAKEEMKKLGEPGEYSEYLAEMKTLIDDEEKSLKERWFVGNHGDVGGSWPIDVKEGEPIRGGQKVSKYQLSDISLYWMLSELRKVEKDNAEDDKLMLTAECAEFLRAMENGGEDEAIRSRIHDILAFRGGSYRQLNIIGTLFWWILESIPLFKRQELVNGEWASVYWPPNLGDTRDIPCRKSSGLFAQLHTSARKRHELEEAMQVEQRHPSRPSQLGWLEALHRRFHDLPHTPVHSTWASWFKRAGGIRAAVVAAVLVVVVSVKPVVSFLTGRGYIRL